MYIIWSSGNTLGLKPTPVHAENVVEIVAREVVFSPNTQPSPVDILQSMPHTHLHLQSYS